MMKFWWSSGTPSECIASVTLYRLGGHLRSLGAFLVQFLSITDQDAATQTAAKKNYT